jgi:hypothetical protein
MSVDNMIVFLLLFKKHSKRIFVIKIKRNIQKDPKAQPVVI